MCGECPVDEQARTLSPPRSPAHAARSLCVCCRQKVQTKMRITKTTQACAIITNEVFLSRLLLFLHVFAYCAHTHVSFVTFCLKKCCFTLVQRMPILPVCVLPVNRSAAAGKRVCVCTCSTRVRARSSTAKIITACTHFFSVHTVGDRLRVFPLKG